MEPTINIELNDILNLISNSWYQVTCIKGRPASECGHSALPRKKLLHNMQNHLKPFTSERKRKRETAEVCYIVTLTIVLITINYVHTLLNTQIGIQMICPRIIDKFFHISHYRKWIAWKVDFNFFLPSTSSCRFYGLPDSPGMM